MKKTRICDNPRCREVADDYLPMGLCPSCRYALKSGLFFGGVIVALCAGIIKIVVEVLHK